MTKTGDREENVEEFLTGLTPTTEVVLSSNRLLSTSVFPVGHGRLWRWFRKFDAELQRSRGSTLDLSENVMVRREFFRVHTFLIDIALVGNPPPVTDTKVCDPWSFGLTGVGERSSVRLSDRQ